VPASQQKPGATRDRLAAKAKDLAQKVKGAFRPEAKGKEKHPPMPQPQDQHYMTKQMSKEEEEEEAENKRMRSKFNKDMAFLQDVARSRAAPQWPARSSSHARPHQQQHRHHVPDLVLRPLPPPKTPAGNPKPRKGKSRMSQIPEEESDDANFYESEEETQAFRGLTPTPPHHSRRRKPPHTPPPTGA
jgi:hypothetical protein